jgi:hypothetical protein
MNRVAFCALFVLLLGSCMLREVPNANIDNLSKSVLYPPLTNVEPEPAGTVCEYGGEKITIGRDKNHNGILEPTEIVQEKTVCDQQGEFNALVLETGEAPGKNCEYGGKLVKKGLDIDRDELLDETEVKGLEFVCSRAEDFDVLASTVDEPAGKNCEFGGKKTDSGYDLNKDQTLNEQEIKSSSYFCSKREDFPPVSKMVNIDPGSAECALGGKKIMHGFDTNSSGVLDDDEILESNIICSKAEDFEALVSNFDEPAGANCELGGKKIISGYDTNQNKLVDDNEINNTSYYCNKKEDFKAVSKLVVLEFGSTECPLGGNKVLIGYDVNSNDELDVSEIEADKTMLNCLKPEDFKELKNTVQLALGDAKCELGGEKIDVWKDYNSDSKMDAGEIISTSYSCKTPTDFNSIVIINELPVGDQRCKLGGKETLTGRDYNENGVLDKEEVSTGESSYNCYVEADFNELVQQVEEPMGSSNCRYGGTKILRGLDLNRDGLLNPDEIDGTKTDYSCLGPENFNTLVVVSDEPFGSQNCLLGGKRTDTGLDLNRDGALDADELTDTSYDCYTTDHFNLLSRSTPEPNSTNCSLGGFKIEQGRDFNNNGALDEIEIDSKLTSYDCRSPLDFDLLKKISSEPKGDNCKLGGTKVESGRDVNVNGVLDPEETDLSLTNYVCTLSFDKSIIESSSKEVASGSSISIKLKLIDEMGVPVNRSDIQVEFFTVGGGTSVGELSQTIDNGDGTYSALFTGSVAGTPITISAIIEGEEIKTDLPTIIVIGSKATNFYIEDKPDGKGLVVGDVSIVGNKTITLYAVSRDGKGNFVANESVSWSTSTNAVELSGTVGTSVTLYPRAVSDKTTVKAEHASLGGASTGGIAVSWNGLVASFGFDDNLTDRSGNGVSPVNDGATFIDGKKGRALDFNGKLVSGQAYYPHVTIADRSSLNMTSAGSLAAWVYINTFTSYGCIVMKGNEDTFKDEAYSLNLYNYGTRANQLVMSVKHDLSSSAKNAYSGNNVFGSTPTGKWSFVVGTWDASGIRVYVDGVEQGINTAAMVAQIMPGDVHIGSPIAGKPYPKGTNKSAFVGRIDELTIWNRALSPAEISYFYNGGNGR